MTNNEILEDLIEIRKDAEKLRDFSSIEANEFPQSFNFDIMQEIVNRAEEVMSSSDRAIRTIKRIIEDEGEGEV